jgi:class 3 adenylate cyclase
MCWWTRKKRSDPPEHLCGHGAGIVARRVREHGDVRCLLFWDHSLYEVYSRLDPYYYGENHLEVLREVADPKINKRPTVPDSCSDEMAALMRDSLEAEEPLRRPTFESLDLRLKRLEIINAEPRVVGLSARQSMKSAVIGRSEELLLSVFPRHIAEALRDGKKIEPESRDHVTVVFSDVVSHTDISSTATKVSDLLDRLHLKLDFLSDKHDIFKFDSTGNSYMAVTNLVKDQPDDGVKGIAEFAVEACEAASDILIDVENPFMGAVQMRIGFHTEPVVASVVGGKSPRRRHCQHSAIPSMKITPLSIYIRIC